MGYRFYLYKIKKAELERVRDISLQELIKNHKKDGYVDFENVAEIEYLHELATCNDIKEQIASTEKEFFTSKEVMDYFWEHDIYIVGKDDLLRIIEFYQDRVIRYLEDCLIDTKHEYTDELITSEVKIKRDVEQELRDWKQKHVLNLYENCSDISFCYTYRYAIFNLVHYLKTIDWEIETLILYGC